MAHGKVSLLAASIMALVLLGSGARAQIPSALAAPPEQTPVVTLQAEGAQIYECKTGGDGKLAWAFREPIATLILDGHTVGRHYAGPNWEHMDGSIVTGKVVASAPGATPSDIAWLRLDAVKNRGSGIFADVATVQRINTSGGALVGACERAGALQSAPYAADYVFLRKAN